MAEVLRLSHLIEKTNVLGPGSRYIVWLQGCAKRCEGCINPEGQSLEGGFMIPIKELLDRIRTQPDIQGVTISGGEPFLQFEGLDRLVTGIKRETHCDIMLYSGYQLAEIVSKIGQERSKKFFSNIDIFIDGEYKRDLDYGSIYRGSDNQNIYFFTDKYAAYRESIYATKNRDVEFVLDEKGETVMIGIPPKNFYQSFLKEIGVERT